MLRGMWSLLRPDRRIFDHARLTISAGACDPSGNYLIEYYDVDEDDFTEKTIAPNAQATMKVLDNSRVSIRSQISSGASNQAWQLNNDVISGRAVDCSFLAVRGVCGLSLSRSTVDSTVVNTISDLTGSISNKTYSDFTVGS